jgi:hypothetical protein
MTIHKRSLFGRLFQLAAVGGLLGIVVHGIKSGMSATSGGGDDKDKSFCAKELV